MRQILLHLNVTRFKLAKDEKLKFKSAKDDQLKPVHHLSSGIHHFTLRWKYAMNMIYRGKGKKISVVIYDFDQNFGLVRVRVKTLDSIVLNFR